MTGSDIGGQEGVRRRRHGEHKSEQSEQKEEVSPYDEGLTGSENIISSLLTAGNKMAGLLVMIFLSYNYSRYLYMLQENDLWFSEIMVSTNI